MEQWNTGILGRQNRRSGLNFCLWPIPPSFHHSNIPAFLEEFLLFSGHLAGFPGSPFMVIPHEVKDAMNDQKQDHLFFLQPEPARFSLSGFSRDDHVSEEFRMERGEWKLLGLWPGLPGRGISFYIVPLDAAHKAAFTGHVPVAFPHREGNDVGGFVPLEIASIQPLNLSVIDERDADFGIRQGQVGQYRLSRPSYLF